MASDRFDSVLLDADSDLHVDHQQKGLSLKRVVIESPFAGDVETHLTYLRCVMHDCLTRRFESPYASHGLYTQAGVLDDKIQEERSLGIEAGFAWRDVADLSAFYIDFGMSSGMVFGLSDATKKGRKVAFRAFLKGYELPSEDIIFENEIVDDTMIFRVAAEATPTLITESASLLDALRALKDVVQGRLTNG